MALAGWLIRNLGTLSLQNATDTAIFDTRVSTVRKATYDNDGFLEFRCDCEFVSTGRDEFAT